MASSTLSTTTGDSPSPLQRAPARRQSRGQQQYSDNQTYPYAFHPRDDSVLLHVQRLIVLAIFSPLMVLSWVRTCNACLRWSRSSPSSASNRHGA